MRQLSVSIVIYNNTPSMVDGVVNCIIASNLDVVIVIVDNSPTPTFFNLKENAQILYIHCPDNPGFGIGHNRALTAINHNSRYHLILNPDILFSPNVLPKMLAILDDNKQIGLLSPKVIYPSGDLQYLCKLLPRPVDLILRWVLDGRTWLAAINYRYEMKYTGYNQMSEVPFLSGCFMLIPTPIIKEVHGFDPRFFLYFEDTDLCRRIHERYRTIFFPSAVIVHNYERGAYKNFKLLFVMIKSAVIYFNKWGWIFDKTRNTVNDKYGIRNINQSHRWFL